MNKHAMKLKQKGLLGEARLILRILLSTSLLASAVVQADESPASNWSFVGGVKLWENSWQSWIVVPTAYNKSSRGVIETIQSSTELAVVPQLGVRYGNWLGAVSTLVPTNYTLTPSWGQSLAASRREYDANVGYYVLPGLAVTAGYKDLEQKFGGTFKWRGPTIGASGTASLGKGFALYGTLGFGVMRAELPFPDGADKSSLNATYFLSETGIAYSFGQVGRLFRSLSLTLGYRSQTLTTKSYHLLDGNQPMQLSSQDVKDTTQGETLSLLAVF